MSQYASGPQGGVSLHSPRYTRYQSINNFTIVQLNTNTALTFNRIVGPQEIVMTLDTVPPTSWSFSIVGGSNTNGLDIVPIYPNTDPYFDPSINYTGPSYPPSGCTVTTQPIPSGTTRINVFRVTSIASGLIFDLALSPYTGIDPTVTLNAPQVAANNLQLKINYFRLSPNLRSEYPISFGAPEYFRKDFVTVFTSSGGVNPLDDLQPHTFFRFNGQQQIKVTNMTTGAYFAFDIDGGIIGNANGYVGYTDPSANTVSINSLENCTVTNPSTTLLAVNRPTILRIVASDGRTYNFTFYFNGYLQTLPTITLVGPVLGADNLEIRNITQTFRTI